MTQRTAAHPRLGAATPAAPADGIPVEVREATASGAR